VEVRYTRDKTATLRRMNLRLEQLRVLLRLCNPDNTNSNFGLRLSSTAQCEWPRFTDRGRVCELSRSPSGSVSGHMVGCGHRQNRRAPARNRCARRGGVSRIGFEGDTLVVVHAGGTERYGAATAVRIEFLWSPANSGVVDPRDAAALVKAVHLWGP
jgi:hypothetical protein